ncbi:MAG: RNA 2',3'-cyclic phosphodiesterase [Thermoleophilia bacterium]|nr:RNA 2',3'-cyclic phosphodiesterase [Thermoleophilia bacterium]
MSGRRAGDPRPGSRGPHDGETASGRAGDDGSRAPRDTLRLFVAGELPGDVRRAIAAWQEAQLAPRRELRLNRSLHLTLCFLGDVAREAVPGIATALRAVRFGAVPLTPAEALFLPERGHKRVVALRLDDPTGALVRLHGAVSAGLEALGLYEPERRPYLPHLTVARFREKGHPFPLQNVNIPEFRLGRVVLYSSLLERGGAVHTPLEIFPAS